MSPILDAGCGRGDWVAFLTKQGYEATGLDYSVEMTEFNRRHYPNCKFMAGRIQAMPFPDDQFNSIVSWGVIEHDPEGPQAALLEFYRVLQPGGRILVTVPVDSEAQRRVSQSEFPVDGGEFFQHFFTQDELAEQVSAAGYVVLETGYCSRPYPSLVWPRHYAAAGKLGRRLLQLCAIFANENFGNMIHCLAKKPERHLEAPIRL
jgi:SAM-dependent methyltransferase